MLTETNAAYDSLASKITRLSVGAQGETQPRTPTNQRRDDFNMVVESLDEHQDVERLKKHIKTIFNDADYVHEPRDVVVMKARQVILKLKNKQEPAKNEGPDFGRGGFGK